MGAIVPTATILPTPLTPTHHSEKYISELQTELQDVVNVQDNDYPYRDFRSIAMKFLFFNADGNHPILRPVKVTHALCAIPCTNQVKHVTTIVTLV